MSLHRTGTPGQGHAGFDRVIVLAEPLGKAWQSLQHTGGGTLQPSIEIRRLPLAHKRRNVLGQVDGLSDLGQPGAQLRELLRLFCRALLLAPEHQPGRPARGKGLVRGFGDDRQRLPSAALSGGQALGLRQPAGIGRDEGIAPGVAPRLEGAHPTPPGVRRR